MGKYSLNKNLDWNKSISFNVILDLEFGKCALHRMLSGIELIEKPGGIATEIVEYFEITCSVQKKLRYIYRVNRSGFHRLNNQKI